MSLLKVLLVGVFLFLPSLASAQQYLQNNVDDNDMRRGEWFFRYDEAGLTIGGINSGPYASQSACTTAQAGALNDQTNVEEILTTCYVHPGWSLVTRNIANNTFTTRIFASFQECVSGTPTPNAQVDISQSCAVARIGQADGGTANDPNPTGGPGSVGGGVAPQTITYRPLAPLPGTTQTELVPYLISLIRLLIGIAGVIGVGKLVLCGFELVTAPGESKKSEAKECVWKVVLGLLIAISGYVLLESINPDLNTLRFAPPLTGTVPTATGTPAGTPTPQGQPTACTDCVNLTVPAKTAAQNGCRMPGPCQISSAVNRKLEILNGLLSGWWVTESYPPTRVHRDACHQAGTCIDADYVDNRSGAADVINFINAANQAGLRAVYEVTSLTEYNALIQAGVPRENIWNGSGWITGNHFSVYNN